MTMRLLNRLKGLLKVSYEVLLECARAASYVKQR